MDRFEWKKINNCYKDAQTYAYRLPVSAETLLTVFARVGETTINNQFRRPSFSAEIGTVRIKGILSEDIIKVSFPENTWQTEKSRFEAWLSEILDQEIMCR